MKNTILIISIVMLLTASLLWGGGQQEQEPQNEPEPSETVEAREETTSPEPEPEYTEAQEKLAAIGFQLPVQSFEAPDFILTSLEGEEYTLTQLEGKLIFLNFWATWCGPCRAEMPSMEVLYQELPADEFEMIAVNVREPRETVEAFIEENGYTYPILLDESGQVSGMYQVQGIPTTWIIDSRRNVLGRLVGTTEWDTPEKIEIFEFLLKNK